MGLAETYDFNLTQDQIVTEALRDIGVLDEVNSEPKAEALLVGRRRLNMIIKNLQVRGIFLWTMETVTVELQAGVSSYALDPKYIGVVQASLRLSDDDTPIEVIRRTDYEGVSNKSETGRPQAVVVDTALDSETGLSTLTLQAYPVPDSNDYTLRVVLDRKLRDFDRSTDNPDAPAWFLRPLVKILAADLGRVYGLPMDIIMDLRREGYTLMEECMHRATDEFESHSGIAGYL